MLNEMMRRELQEAENAAETALVCLQNAGEELRKARNWGIYDILGGGFLSTMLKRSRMRSASEYLEAAGRAVRNLCRELRDVEQVTELDFDTDSFLVFADYFMDGLFADLMVQKQIRDAQERVSTAVCEVTKIRKDLREKLAEI